MRANIDFRVVCFMYLNERTLCKKFASSLSLLTQRCQEINSDSINAYLKRRLEDFSSVTAANERRQLMTLWRWAWENGKVKHPPRGVIRIKQRPKPIEAWTLGDLVKIIDKTEEYQGQVMRCGAEKSLFLRSWIMLGYETGARWGDLWSMTEDSLRGNVITWSTHKTNVVQHRPLTKRCLRDVNAMLEVSPDGSILSFVCNKRHAMRVMKKFLEECDMPGSSRWLRRSGATHVEITNPGKAKAFLGHKSPNMADKHYIDHSQIRSEDIVVPSY